jgi:hypothetical protein
LSRNPHIKSNQIDELVGVIRSWQGSDFSWELICSAAEAVLGYRPSRSGLSSHREILLAFQARKSHARGGVPTSRPLPSSLSAASLRIQSKDAEIAELKRVVSRFEERFERWQYNARLFGMTLAELDEPLPSLDRVR